MLVDSSLQRPHVAYALGRATGPATVRNRLRRQLRAVVANADRDAAVAPGWYLLGADAPATTLSFGELTLRVPELLASAVSKNSAKNTATRPTRRNVEAGQ